MRLILGLPEPVRLISLVLLLMPGGFSAATGLDAWSAAGTIDGIEVLARPSGSGFDAHRAEVLVCADMMTLEAFVEDTSRFKEWVPYTREVTLLASDARSVTYYVRTSTPWPMRDRDMVYRLSRIVHPGVGLRIAVSGLPEHINEIPGVVRMRSASGEWWLRPAGEGLRVSYELHVDPGPVPRFLANQRLAAAVGRTLANLEKQFPCPAPGAA